MERNPKLSVPFRYAVLLGACWAVGAVAQVPETLRSSPFYGGLSIRDQGSEQGVVLGQGGNWARFSPAVPDPASVSTVLFGGYRWRNDLAVEAAIAGNEGYRLSGGRGGVGLLAPGADAAQRSWNVDVYANWAFWRSLSLYGRLGYSQTEAMPVYSTSVTGASRLRDGVNVGVGLRYDVTRSLGLKLEYARVGSYAAEVNGFSLPEVDQLQFGLQFRF